MSTSALEALRVCELLDKNDRVVDLTKFRLIDLQKKLDYYRDTRIRSVASDSQNSLPDAEDLAAVLSSSSAQNDVKSLLSSCFAYNRTYANDPLLKFARPKDDVTNTYNQWLGTSCSSELKVEDVVESLNYFSRLSPLIRIGALTVLPIEELVTPVRASGEGVPVFYSEDWFRSEVPQHIHEFVHQKAIVREVAPVPDGGGFFVFQHAPKDPTRGIAIQFENDGSSSCPPFYLLSEARIVERVGETHVRIAQELDWENPPSRASFDAWVYQSVNRTIITRIRDIAREISIANALQATYLTESQFESELCGLSFESPTDPGDRTTAVNFLNANAQYLQLEDPLILARLRTENARLFERWQYSLLAAIHELNGYEGNFAERAKQLFESEIQPQVNEMNKSLLKLSSGIGGATLVTAGTIGMALIANASLPFAVFLGLGALSAAGKSMPSVAEYLAFRRGPAFVWSKIVKN